MLRTARCRAIARLRGSVVDTVPVFARVDIRGQTEILRGIRHGALAQVHTAARGPEIGGRRGRGKSTPVLAGHAEILVALVPGRAHSTRTAAGDRAVRLPQVSTVPQTVAGIAIGFGDRVQVGSVIGVRTVSAGSKRGTAASPLSRAAGLGTARAADLSTGAACLRAARARKLGSAGSATRASWVAGGSACARSAVAVAR